jgi:hypothetical protein
MITNKIDNYLGYNYAKRFYKKHSLEFTSIENYLNHTYSDSINSMRNNKLYWEFATEMKINKIKYLNPNAYDYDKFLDNKLEKLGFPMVSYNPNTKVISYDFIVFPNFYFSNRFYFSIINFSKAFGAMPLGDEYYLIIDDE